MATYTIILGNKVFGLNHKKLTLEFLYNNVQLKAGQPSTWKLLIYTWLMQEMMIIFILAGNLGNVLHSCLLLTLHRVIQLIVSLA